MTEILVRDANNEDHAALTRIFRRAALSNPGDRDTLLAHPEFLRLPVDLVSRGRTRVATVLDGTIVGFAGTGPIGDGALELDDLFVDPDWRRHGAARRLVHLLASEAREEGMTRIEVTANEHALGFYRAVGFVSDGQTDTPFGPGHRMRLDVAGRQ